jgi:hypothetical protein
MRGVLWRAGANGNKIERANGNKRTATRERTATRQRQQEDDAPHPGGNDSTCPPEAAARLEAWLLSTRGAELRKAKSLDTALRSMAHVTFVWSLEATQPAVAFDPTRRPQETKNLCQFRLPDAAPARRDGRNGFAGHLIGRRGKFIKPLLERWPQVRVRIEGDTVSVSGPLAADVELVANRLQRKVLAQLSDSNAIIARERERERLREMKNGRPKITWTGLPKIRPFPCLHSCDGLDDLDRERDYRERLREREGRGQTVLAHQHEGRKKMRTRTRIGCKGRPLHLRPRRGGTKAGARGVALDLSELLADLFC